MLNSRRCSTLQPTNLLHYMHGRKTKLAECEFGKKIHHEIFRTTDAQIHGLHICIELHEFIEPMSLAHKTNVLTVEQFRFPLFPGDKTRARESPVLVLTEPYLQNAFSSGCLI